MKLRDPKPTPSRPDKFVDTDASAFKTFATKAEYDAYCRKHGLDPLEGDSDGKGEDD